MGYGFCCGLLFIRSLPAIAIILIIGGLVGTIIAIRKKKNRVIAICVLIFGIFLGINIGISNLPKEFWLNRLPSYQLGDLELQPFEHAITDIDRSSFGLTPIPTDAKIKILYDQEGYVSCPDAELYIPDLPFKRQHICLEKVGDTYLWYEEYEVYLGPEEWDTLWLAYSSTSTPLGGDYEPYTLIIDYRVIGDDRFLDKSPSLEDIQPIIEEWRNYHLSNP